MSSIGILYPGALGAAFGRAVTEAGWTAITCISGRSRATAIRAAAAAFIVVPSLEEVARRSDLVVSLVPPNRAIEVSRSFAAVVGQSHHCRGRAARPIFIDANSVSPRTKHRIGDILSHAGIRYLDGTFFGPANQAGHENVLALSGSGADQIAHSLRQVIEVRVLGEDIGQASALKMALAIMTKAIPAVFLETICASANSGQLDATLEMIRRLYPGIMSFLERTLPTYPSHVARRIQELEEAADWLHEIGQCGIMTQSAVTVLEGLRHTELEPGVAWPFKDLLQCIAQTDLLHVTHQSALSFGPKRM